MFPGPPTESDMHITERTTNDIIILDLEGKLTIGDGAELLRDQGRQRRLPGLNTKIILNLAGVPYIDSWRPR